MTKKLNYILYLFILISTLLFVTCSKQRAPSIGIEEIRGTREVQRLEACSKVNFNKGVLLYQNMIHLFICSKWDEQFPHMFSSMNKISAMSWNHIMAPIDQAFIENQQRRDRFFGNIRELDSKNGLNDFSYVLMALTENNFFDIAKDLFACVDNPLDPICLIRLGKIPSKKSLKNIIKFVDTTPESINNLSQITKFFLKALDGHQENLRIEINKVRASPLYILSRQELIDSLALKVRAGFSDEDRLFLSKFFLTGDSKGDRPWIFQWIQDVKMNREKFRDLLEYPILINPDFINEVKNLEGPYNDGLSCTIKNSNISNKLVEFDFKTYLAEYVSVIKGRSYKEFYDFSSADIFGLKMSTEVCKELESNHYGANFIKTLEHFSDFLGEKKFYDLVRFLLSQTTAKGDLDKTFSENLYLFSMATGNIFSSANKFNKNIISSTRDLYPVIFDIVKNLPPLGYINLGKLAEAAGHPEIDDRNIGLVDFWMFLTPKEKNFAFNFFDRHFDKKVNYPLLFEFYTKFLDEFKEVQPAFRDKWMGTGESLEMSYLSFQDVFSRFSGEKTLSDFRKFFSRDQILKVLEVIANGQKTNWLAQLELQYINSTNYIIQSAGEHYKFGISYNDEKISDYNAKEVLECMKFFSDVQNGFYQLVRNLPLACSKVTNTNIAFRLYGWLNIIEDEYLKFKETPEKTDSLLDKNGMLSPYMINSSMGLAKIIDNMVGPLGSKMPTKNGVNYLLSSTNYFLNQKAAAHLIEENLDWLGTMIEIRPEENIQHRNSLIKSLAREDNFSYLKTAFNNWAKIFSDYGNWVRSGELQKAQARNLGSHDSRFDCEKIINQTVAPYPCPNKELVKKHGGEMLFLLQNVWEEDQGSSIAQLMKASKTGEGLEIPLRGKKTRKIRMTLEDAFRFMYDTSDKSLDINRIDVKYVNEKEIESVENITTLERIETVIREVRFGNNYLGVSYSNAVVHGSDYNKSVRGRKSLLTKCVKIPIIRCGKKMSDSDIRMANNALSVYDALLDVNDGRGMSPSFNFGDYLKTFQTALVASSSKDAQKVQIFPLKESALLKHNGKILTEMALLNLWNNAARIVRDRVGRTREDFDKFINSREFKKVDKAILRGFDFPAAAVSAEHLINKINSKHGDERQTFFENMIDWISTLSYDETRLVEDTLARLILVGSYLGAPETVFGVEGDELLAQKYGNNNLFQMFLALEKIIDHWPTLKNYFPIDIRLVDVVKPINTGLYFLTTKLIKEEDPNKNFTYMALNDLFLALQTTFFDNMPMPNIGGDQKKMTKGLDFFLEAFKDSKLVVRTYALIKGNYRYLDVLHQNNGEWFSAIGQNIERLATAPIVDFNPFRDFLSFTSKNVVCQSGESICKANYHYDEAANLVKFLNKKSETGISNFMLMNQRIFLENFDQISQMIDDLLPALRIKEIKAAPNFN